LLIHNEPIFNDFKNFIYDIKQLKLTAFKQYCLAAGATQGNIAYTQNVMGKFNKFK
jgi:hypothetical protein